MTIEAKILTNPHIPEEVATLLNVILHLPLWQYQLLRQELDARVEYLNPDLIEYRATS